MNRRVSFRSVVVALALLVALPALAGQLTRVEPKRVCMMNDTVFQKDQIPIDVGGKTYFGCCAMCKERLASDAKARQAIDPVSGDSVDKATAVIGAQPDGKVLYFQNEKNFAAFNQRH